MKMPANRSTLGAIFIGALLTAPAAALAEGSTNDYGSLKFRAVENYETAKLNCQTLGEIGRMSADECLSQAERRYQDDLAQADAARTKGDTASGGGDRLSGL